MTPEPARGQDTEQAIAALSAPPGRRLSATTPNPVSGTGKSPSELKVPPRGPHSAANGISIEDAEASLAANLDFTRALVSAFPTAANYRDAIRRKCLDCCVGNKAEVNRCQMINCALWPFRFRSNPFRAPKSASTTE